MLDSGQCSLRVKVWNVQSCFVGFSGTVCYDVALL